MARIQTLRNKLVRASGPGDQVRAAGELVGVLYNAGSKRKVRATGGELLGAYLEGGAAGRIGVPAIRLRWLALAGAILLLRWAPTSRGLLNWLGRFGFACLFRRPAWAWRVSLRLRRPRRHLAP